MEHEHLAVAVTARADADRGHRHRLGDHAGHRVGDALEDDAEHAGLGQRDRVVDDDAGGVERLALHAEAAERVDRLRREAEVAHHRDLGVEDRPHVVETLAPALELHRAGAGPDQAGRVGDVSCVDRW